MSDEIRVKLTAPQKKFVKSTAKFPCMVGGLGCMRDSTEVLTRDGYKPIADLTYQDEVVSWNEKDQLYQLAPTSGA